MSLERWQRAFVDAVYAGEAPSDLFTPETAHRFAAYAGGLPARFEESLRAAFPAVERLTGHAFFHAAAAGYARANRSTTWDLARVGDGFPAYLAAHPALAPHPYVAEVAALEAALHAIFFLRDDAPAAGFPESPGDLAAWRPAFSPTLRLCEFAWPVLALYERAEAPEAPPERRPETLLVYRDPAGTAAARRLAPAQARLQRALLAGAAFGDALDAAEDLDAAGMSALAALWVSERLLRATGR